MGIILELVRLVAAAILGGLAASWLNINVFEYQRRYEIRKRFAISLLAELRVAGDWYRQLSDLPLRELIGQPFTTIYDANTNVIGTFNPRDVTRIVKTMTDAKVHLGTVNAGRASKAVIDELVNATRQMYDALAVPEYLGPTPGFHKIIRDRLSEPWDQALRFFRENSP